MRRFWLALAALLVAVVGPAYAADGSSTEPTRGLGPVVVVGFSGLTWANLDDAPNLAAFARGSAVANVVVRTVGETTCPSEGWLTVGAGQRATDSGSECVEHAVDQAAGGASLPDWKQIVAANASSSYAAPVGLLGDEKSLSTLAIGQGAALALADSSGAVATYASGDEGSDVVYRREAGSADLVVVDLGAVTYPKRSVPTNKTVALLKAAFAPLGETPDSVRAQISDVDARFGRLLAAIRTTTPEATIVVTSVGDGQQVAQLGYFAMQGSRVGSEPGTWMALAGSDATRQKGLVQLTDLTPTLLEWLAPGNAALDRSVGSAIHAVNKTKAAVDPHASKTPLIAAIQDQAARSHGVRPYIGVFYVCLVVLLAIVCGLWIRRHKLKNIRFAVQLAAWVAALPVASLLVNLVPWWRGDSPGGVLATGIVMIAALIAGAGLLVKRSGSVLIVVGAVTAGVVGLDVVIDRWTLSYPLHLGSLLGVQPQVGGRFYGFSNSTFAMFTAGLVLVLASFRAGKQTAAAIGVIGLAAAFVDGSPMFGADFGGPPVIVVSCGILILIALRARPTVLRLCGIGMLALAVSVGFAVFDYLRMPSDRTHLGRFVRSVVDGGSWNVIERKISQAVFGLPWWVVIIATASVVVVALWLWKRNALGVRINRWFVDSSWDIVNSSTVALAVGLVIGMLINDSGMVIPMLGFAVAAPLWVAVRLSDGCAQ